MQNITIEDTTNKKKENCCTRIINFITDDKTNIITDLDDPNEEKYSNPRDQASCYSPQ